MTVPNQFGTATSAIPLSQLDANFNTPITLGNTAIQLGDTVTTLNNMTLANVTISSGTITITNVAVTTANVSGTANVSTLVVVGNATVGGNTTITGNITSSTLTSGCVTYATTSGRLTDSANLLYSGTDLTVYGLTVGRGAGAVATNTAVGVSALATNGAGLQNTAVGNVALTTNGAGSYNSAFGFGALNLNSSGSYNTAIGNTALVNNTASNNTAVGYQAGYTNQTGSRNTFIGEGAGYITTSSFNAFIGNHAGYNTTGGSNTFVGDYSGYLVTSGAKNTILGKYDGFDPPISGTGSNYIVLSDGDGNVEFTAKDGNSWALPGATVQTGTGITFPATQSASSNANTLDDYEEGTFTPEFTSTGLTVSYGQQRAIYTKIGRSVIASMYMNVSGTSGTTTNLLKITGLPFASVSTEYGFSAVFGVSQFSTYIPSAFMQSSVSEILVYRQNTVTSMTGAELANGFYLLTITYFTA